MAFKIQYTDPANRDLDEVLVFIAKDSHVKARKWLDGLIAAVEELKFAPEFAEAELIIRSFHYHSHRCSMKFEVHMLSSTVFGIALDTHLKLMA